MELQVPYRICAEISTTSGVWEDQNERRQYPTDVVRAEESGNIGSACMSGSHPHAGEYSTKPKRIAIHGVSEGKEFPDDI
jgi:hypothetical protein